MDAFVFARLLIVSQGAIRVARNLGYWLYIGDLPSKHITPLELKLLPQEVKGKAAISLGYNSPIVGTQKQACFCLFPSKLVNRQSP